MDIESANSQIQSDNSLHFHQNITMPNFGALVPTGREIFIALGAGGLAYFGDAYLTEQTTKSDGASLFGDAKMAVAAKVAIFSLSAQLVYNAMM